MFRSILKYTPLLKRVFIIVLCFVLFSCIFIKPITAKAYVAYDPATAGLYAAFKLWDLIPQGQNPIVDVLAKIVEAVGERAAGGAVKFQSLFKLLSSLTGNGVFKLSADDIDSLRTIIYEDVFLRTTLGFANVQSKDEILTGATSGVQMYVPTEDAMWDMDSITEMQILYTGFMNDTVEELESVNETLYKIRVFLGQMHNELYDKIAGLGTILRSINTNISDRLSDMRTELYHINSNLTDRLTTLHESFRNLKEHMDTRLLDIRSMQTTINQNLTDRLSDMRKMMTTINTTLTDRLSKLHDSLRVLKADVISKLDDIYEMQTLYLGDVAGQLSIIDSSLVDVVAAKLADLHTTVEGLNTIFDDWLIEFGQLQASLNTEVLEKLTTIHSSITNLKEHMDTRLLDIRSMQTTINQNLTDRLSDMRKMMSTINSNITDRLSKLHESVRVFKADVLSELGDLENVLITGFPALQNSLDQILQGIPALQKSLDEILGKIPQYGEIEIIEKPQIEVQIGQQQIVVSDYATLGQAFSAKMSWIPEIFDFLAELRSRLDSGSPPRVSVNLASAGGSIDWGDEVVVMDMSWYAPYKPMFDNIISGCLWLCFGWAIYKRIPDILSGVGLTVENATEPRGNVWSDRAARSERRSNKGG